MIKASSASPPLCAPAHVLNRARLFVDVQHGLGNRLRAMASAAVIAEATGRDLHLIWSPDHHCEARISDVLDYDGPVIEDVEVALLLRARPTFTTTWRSRKAQSFSSPSSRTRKRRVATYSFALPIP